MVYSNQQSELKRKQINRQAWDFCIKYSNLFERNIDNKNLDKIIQDSYKNFVSNIKSMKVIIKHEYKYTRMWKTLLNTINKNPHLIKNAVKNFNYSIYINSLKNN